MTWNPITSEADAVALLDAFGNFHDACLREAHIWTEHWVSDDLAMAVSTEWDTRARILIQRQYRPTSAIELCFAEVRHFHLAPSPPNYSSDIFSALLLVQADGIRWADHDDWNPSDPYQIDCTWIHAGKLQWRDASEWMGEPLRFGAGDVAPPAV